MWDLYHLKILVKRSFWRLFHGLCSQQSAQLNWTLKFTSSQIWDMNGQVKSPLSLSLCFLRGCFVTFWRTLTWISAWPPVLYTLHKSHHWGRVADSVGTVVLGNRSLVNKKHKQKLQKSAKNHIYNKKVAPFLGFFRMAWKEMFQQIWSHLSAVPELAAHQAVTWLCGGT